MILKSYLNIKDWQLLERYNSDWMLQYFCDKVLAEDQQVRDMTILTMIRAYLEKHCEWKILKEVLTSLWKPDVNNTLVLLMDANCYESYIRFPTDVKLLWEFGDWLFEDQLFRICSVLGIRRQRSKYREQKIEQMSCFRKRKNSFKKTLKRRKALVYLLGKGIA
ncbi:hypothetical protein [Belliella pelovolcani]|uniref:Uncharacterized protein n=1 Tax=Belliella pelovolcani TaxID=529505 RepID=A0A1N7KHE1_9BACT|nr:hypothetical protein [Belliella pelovolcani]SIS60949.1 hypothetical protein SAMN05421761_10278 [Belliella pelovolcani]